MCILSFTESRKPIFEPEVTFQHLRHRLSTGNFAVWLDTLCDQYNLTQIQVLEAYIAAAGDAEGILHYLSETFKVEC